MELSTCLEKLVRWEVIYVNSFIYDGVWYNILSDGLALWMLRHCNCMRHVLFKSISMSVCISYVGGRINVHCPIEMLFHCDDVVLLGLFFRLFILEPMKFFYQQTEDQLKMQIVLWTIRSMHLLYKFTHRHALCHHFVVYYDSYCSDWVIISRQYLSFVWRCMSLEKASWLMVMLLTDLTYTRILVDA